MAMRAQLWSVSGLAVEFKLDRRTVAKRIEAVPPAADGPKGAVYRLADVAPLLVERQAAESTIEDAEKRKIMAEAELAEMKVGERRGVLIDVGTVSTELDRIFAAIRARLLGIPPKLAPILAPGDPAGARLKLEAAVHEVLAELRATGEEIEAHDDDGSASPAAADHP